MKYTHVRFAYYDTRTDEPYLPEVLDAEKVVPDLLTEIKFRATHFVAVAEHVADQIAGSAVPPGGRLLTIFAAPEFYLRSAIGMEKGLGQYAVDHVQTARALIGSLVRKSTRFEDWLLIPGTALYSEFPLISIIWNDAYCVAKINGAIQSWNFVKQYFSTTDGVEIGLNAFTRKQVPKGVIDPYSITMSVNGIDIGLEICLDHRLGALKGSVMSGKSTNVDVQLLVSCGADIQPENVVARSNGLVGRINGNLYNLPSGKEFQVGKWPNGKRVDQNELAPLIDYSSGPYHHDLLLPPQLQLRSATGSDTAGYFDPLPLTPPPGPPPGGPPAKPPPKVPPGPPPGGPPAKPPPKVPPGPPPGGPPTGPKPTPPPRPPRT